MPRPEARNDPLHGLCFDLAKLGAAAIGTPRGEVGLLLRALAWFTATIFVDFKDRDPPGAAELYAAFLAELDDYVRTGDCTIRPDAVPPQRPN